LLRIISGAEPFNGEREWGHNVVESFYAQHQLEALHLENNLLEEMQTTRSGKTELELRSLLGAFLFSGDNVNRRGRRKSKIAPPLCWIPGPLPL
jgi:ATP-binding cassette subfamily F protein 3